MSLLSVEKSQLKSALLRDQSATEDLKHTIELRLMYIGSFVKTCGRSLYRNFSCSTNVQEMGQDIKNVITCNCPECFATTDIATGDQVRYLIEGTNALVVCRKGNELDSDTTCLVARGNFEVGSILGSPYVIIFNDSISSCEPSSRWQPRVRSGSELVLDLTMKDFLWAMTSMYFKICYHRELDSAGFCWDQGDLKGVALLPRDTRQKETLCLWHRKPFTNSKYSYRWEQSIVIEQSIAMNGKPPSAKKREKP